MSRSFLRLSVHYLTKDFLLLLEGEGAMFRNLQGRAVSWTRGVVRPCRRNIVQSLPPILDSPIIWFTNINCRRKFRSQTSDIFRQYRKMEKQRWEESEKRREEERRSEKRKSQKKEDAGARKGSKVAKHCVFPMICGSGGRKVGSLKRWVRSHLARWVSKSD